MYLIFNKFARQVKFWKLHIQMPHQWSLVIGSLTPCESIFRQTDVNLVVTAFIHNAYVHFFFPEMLPGLEVGN